ncbi:YybH family protein [Kribbella shirazensis]|uniref:Ketosteroid isomerase-like protein n=1 Tax=Kribbella shirazensis TaxID=1105143 RepID=A0A7X5V7A9_9ACTN|nr:nuclear transport factor 2 family protein [Kribbella shirazensis]NIK55237.1 ketosteroid isomerase-like protein [Kribbella shirazensis]
MTDEQAIRTLIENWVTAVHAGDLDTVLADHARDLVMFDVPPPYDGVRGLDAYRDTWPGFFEWQKSGASFALESLEVTAGSDVAFAFALLHCRNADDNPERLLRLTIGLRKVDGRWTVTHEHHSFPHDDEPAAPAITAILDRWGTDTAARDLDALMEPIAEDVVSYEIDGNYVGKPAVREVCAAGLATAPGTITFTVPDPAVESAGDLAVAWSVDHITADGTETTSRATRVFRRTGDGWKLIHQHLSYPAS